MEDFKLYIQSVYIPRENIFFVEEWLKYHSKLGVDEFYLYDNSGSVYKDFVGNLELDGKNKNGWNVKELTKDLSDVDIVKIEDELFSKYNVTRIKWQPLDNDGNVTYGQVLAINDFLKYANKGFCAFIDIDEFIVLKGDSLKDYINLNYNSAFDGIKICQRKFVNRWYNRSSVTSIKATLDINTFRWAPKIIANLGRLRNAAGSIHDFMRNLMNDDENIHFNHYNHDVNSHNWLLMNYDSIDPYWVPVEFNTVLGDIAQLVEQPLVLPFEGK